MIKKIAMILLVIVFCFAVNGRGQGDCGLKMAELKPFVPGYEGKDSITLSDMLNAGKLVTKLKGLEVVSFHIATNNGCVDGGGLYCELHCTSNELSGEAVRLLKRSAGQSFYFEHVHAVNKMGEKYCLKPFTVFVRKP